MAVLTERRVRRRPKKRRTFELTEPEQMNVRRALRVIRGRYGSWRLMARKLGCSADILAKAANPDSDRPTPPSAAMALRVSQAIGVAVEDVLSGAWLRDVACPMCGRSG